MAASPTSKTGTITIGNQQVEIPVAKLPKISQKNAAQTLTKIAQKTRDLLNLHKAQGFLNLTGVRTGEKGEPSSLSAKEKNLVEGVLESSVANAAQSMTTDTEEAARSAIGLPNLVARYLYG